MPKETEKRWLVSGDTWRNHITAEPTLITQGYVAMSFGNTVRVRLSAGALGHQGSIECKGNRNHLIVDDESAAVPANEAERWLTLFCQGRTLKKLRHRIRFHGQIFDVDVFSGHLEPLVIAKAELKDASTTPVLLPGCTDEVSHDVGYSNYHLATKGLPRSFRAWLRGQPSY